MEIHVHIHNDEVKLGKKPRTRKGSRKASPGGAKKKRGASAYNKRYAKEYARLKKKHPRSSFAALAKKAHAAARRK